MKKILAVLFACSIVLAGCMDLTDEDVEAIVDAIVEIPGCNADETAYNYDANAPNNNACLTEIVLKDSITDFINLMDNGPSENQTMGITMEGSGETQGQQMDWTSVEVYSPSGSYSSMELDMGMLVWSQSQLISSAADGTTLIQVDWNGEGMLMNSATDFSTWNSMNLADDDDMDMGDDDDMDMGDDDDMDMGDDDMGMGDMGMPSVEIPDSFDPSTALFEAGLATDNGYAFSTTMDDGMGYSMTMTFTLGMDLVVNSMSITETMDGESTTSSITMLDDDALMGYLTIDNTLPSQALPFTVSQMGGMNGDDDDMDMGDDDDDMDMGDDDENGEMATLIVVMSAWDSDGPNMIGDLNDLSESDQPLDVIGYLDENSAGGIATQEDASSYAEQYGIMFSFSALEGNEFGISSEDIEMVPNFSTYFSSDCEMNAGNQLYSYDTDDNAAINSINEWLECSYGEDDMGDDDDMDMGDDDDDMDNDDMPSETDMFTGMDADQDGNVNLTEATDYFNLMMNDVPTPEDAMEEADYDDSGNISWDEFVINWNENEDETDLDDYHLNNNQDLESQLHEVFNNSDDDASGALELSELQGFIDQVVVIMEVLEDDDDDNDEFMSIINSAFACTDYNADSMLDSTEFSSYYSAISGDMSVEMMLCYMDLDQSGEVSASEFAYWSNQSDDSEPMSDEDWNDFLYGFDMMDTDGSGGLNADELNAVMMSSDDGEDGNDDQGSMFDWMIMNTQDIPMEGSFNDYTIILALCTMDESSDDGMGMGDTPTMTCSDDAQVYSIADAMTQGSDVMFHDADMSGTISNGDMVHISPDINLDDEWNTVRLYSTSANSYSDENPMLTPGFSSMIGIIALLGAALLTRRD